MLYMQSMQVHNHSLWPHLELVLVLQIAMGAFVNYFFSGFIMGKIPFPLSPSFRLMLQVSTLQALPFTACITPVAPVAFSKQQPVASSVGISWQAVMCQGGIGSKLNSCTSAVLLHSVRQCPCCIRLSDWLYGLRAARH